MCTQVSQQDMITFVAVGNFSVGDLEKDSKDENKRHFPQPTHSQCSVAARVPWHTPWVQG